MTNIDLKLKTYDELLLEITVLNTDKYLLQQRIDKAIKIIEQGIDFINPYDANECEKELLNILKGDDTNE